MRLPRTAIHGGRSAKVRPTNPSRLIPSRLIGPAITLVGGRGDFVRPELLSSLFTARRSRRSRRGRLLRGRDLHRASELGGGGPDGSGSWAAYSRRDNADVGPRDCRRNAPAAHL